MSGFGAGSEIENWRGTLLLLCCPGSALWLRRAHSEMPHSAIPAFLDWWIHGEMPLSAIPTGRACLLAWWVRAWAPLRLRCKA